jgi:hypothetical protein
VTTDGVETAAMLIVIGVEVAVPEVESVTTAVSEYVPAAVGVQLTLYGDVVSVPTAVPFARNCTFETVVVPPTVGVALIVTGVPTVLEAGALMVMLVAGTGVTFTVCGLDVTTVPFESVTRAVILCEPSTVVHVAL